MRPSRLFSRLSEATVDFTPTEPGDAMSPHVQLRTLQAMLEAASWPDFDIDLPAVRFFLFQKAMRVFHMTLAECEATPIDTIGWLLATAEVDDDNYQRAKTRSRREHS